MTDDSASCPAQVPPPAQQAPAAMIGLMQHGSLISGGGNSFCVGLVDWVWQVDYEMPRVIRFKNESFFLCVLWFWSV